jgi:hypothetical protein
VQTHQTLDLDRIAHKSSRFMRIYPT